MSNDEPRYFGIVFRCEDGALAGYALDFYPEERDGYFEEEIRYIIGEYDTYQEAMAAVCKRLDDDLPHNLKAGKR